MGRREQQHNLKIAELSYVAFNAGDLATLLKLAHEEIEVHIPEPGVNAGTYKGHDGYAEWFEAWMESFDDYKATPTEVVPIGSRHLVVIARQTATEKESGAPVEMESANMLEFRDGQIAALHLYRTREEAVEAAKKRDAEASDG